MNFKIISYKEASEFLLPRHYSGRIPIINWAFGWYDSNDNLKAVCTVGKPASPAPCKGICGIENSQYVFELNRLCREDDLKEPLSKFVSKCLKYLKTKNVILMSYSDTAMNHHGYIYQACNFLYTGQTKERTDKYTPIGKHPRHYDNNEQGEYRQIRSSKHRYVYFCTNSKTLLKKWKSSFNYPVLPYPKGDNNKDYILGEYLKPIIVKVEKKGIS